TTEVGGSWRLNVVQNRKKSVGGSESVDIKTAQIAGIEGNDTEKVGSVRVTIAGSFDLNIPNPKQMMKELLPNEKTLAASLVSDLGGQIGVPEGGAEALGIDGAGKWAMPGRGGFVPGMGAGAGTGAGTG